ncbi:MAG: hypothetical protein JWQ19_3904 [Subtercola sp.]|nr:hypothetical protein [Subtercola sp.]
MTNLTERTRRLNDLTRTQPVSANASWTITRGVLALLANDESTKDTMGLAMGRVAALRAALAAFSNWSGDNDPYGEHDFGAFELFGARLFFEIDYYHPDHDAYSTVPSSIELCRRVLTVMLAEEY